MIPETEFNTRGMTQGEIIKQLRELSGLSLMRCKKLCAEYNYDLRRAYDNRFKPTPGLLVTYRPKTVRSEFSKWCIQNNIDSQRDDIELLRNAFESGAQSTVVPSDQISRRQQLHLNSDPVECWWQRKGPFRAEGQCGLVTLLEDMPETLKPCPVCNGKVRLRTEENPGPE